MKQQTIKISDNFRKMAIRSVLAILLFMFTYILLFTLAVVFTVLCGYGGLMLVILKPTGLTIMLGLGILGLGFMILVFLVKFMFTSTKTDRSHLYEITVADEPQLFALIKEIVDEVQTNFPKKVYISSEVNAAVFYDSSFWSMFLPVKKNLQIGLGLMNSISVIELKAILAHEFGHFSQRSMKVGSFVYNVNKIIHNMLFDNESYAQMVDQWANVSSYLSIFARIAIKIIQGIQWVLRKVYEVVNINYLALSREMEFHADAVAAEVAGSPSLISSLLRLELADESFSTVLNYYGTKVAAAEKTSNFYPQQYFVMNFLAQKNDLPIVDGLPQLSAAHFMRFKKSKLVLTDQWSSHPGTEERVSQLQLLNKPVKGTYSGIAIDLLQDKNGLAEQVTGKIFEQVTYEKPTVLKGEQQFREDFTGQYNDKHYPDVYKGYYNTRELPSDKTEADFDLADQGLLQTIEGELYTIPNQKTDSNTAEIDLQTNKDKDPVTDIEELFNLQLINTIDTINAMETDLLTLDQISSGNIAVKTFDYDGQKYTAADCYDLKKYISAELVVLNEVLNKKDQEIFEFFIREARAQNKLEELKAVYFAYQRVKSDTQLLDAYTALSASLEFTQQTTPFEQISQNFIEVKKLEEDFKEGIRSLLAEGAAASLTDPEIITNFEEYLSADRIYFESNSYNNPQLDILFRTINEAYYIINLRNFSMKKNLLDFQSALFEATESSSAGIL